MSEINYMYDVCYKAGHDEDGVSYGCTHGRNAAVHMMFFCAKEQLLNTLYLMVNGEETYTLVLKGGVWTVHNDNTTSHYLGGVQQMTRQLNNMQRVMP